MKKIALITNFYIRNYGSVLQSYALYQKLCNMGVDVSVVNYQDVPSRLMRLKVLFLLNYKCIFKIIHRFIIRKKADKKYYFDICKRNESFSLFIKKYCNFTSLCSNVSQLQEVVGSFNILMIGSDQLWAPSDVIRNYHTLVWAPKNIKKVSYATSFGVEVIPNFLHKKYCRFLQKMDVISVREISGRKILHEILKKNVPMVMDPTLLLEKEEWQNILDERLVKEEYIFAFFLGTKKEHRDFVQAVGRKYGLKVVSILHVEEFQEIDKEYADITYNSATPAEFINLIKYASVVFTDSFHASIFSIINERKFYVFNRYDVQAKNSRNTRVDSLLDTLGLSNQKILDLKNANINLSSNIDYIAVKEKLELWRLKSNSYLKQILL